MYYREANKQCAVCFTVHITIIEETLKLFFYIALVETYNLNPPVFCGPLETSLGVSENNVVVESRIYIVYHSLTLYFIIMYYFQQKIVIIVCFEFLICINAVSVIFQKPERERERERTLQK